MGKIGKYSIEFDNKPFISASASVVGQKEGEGPLGEYLTGSSMTRWQARIHGRKLKVKCSGSLWMNFLLRADFRQKKSDIFRG